MPTPTHNLSDAQIEQLVQLVVKRLQSAGANLKRPTPLVTTESNTGSTNRQATTQEESPNPHDWVTTEKLLTVAQLPTDLSTIKRVIVRSDAIVTPAVKDELNDRRIELTRDTAQAQGKAATEPFQTEPQSGLSLVTANSSDCLSMAETLSNKRVARRVQRAQNTGEAVRLLRDDRSAQRVAIGISDQPHELIWQLHRMSVRAGLCRGQSDLQELVGQMKVKVVVLDGRSGLAHNLVDGLIELAAAPDRS